MDFELNEEQRLLVETLRDMGKRENFKKLAVEIDRTGEFPRHLVAKYAELGLLGMTLSPEYGGGGQPAINAILAIEELAKFSPVIATPVFEANIRPGEVSHYVVYCRFGDVPGYKGIGGVIVEKGAQGFTFGKQEEFMGLRGMPSCDLIFAEVAVPQDNARV